MTDLTAVVAGIADAVGLPFSAVGLLPDEGIGTFLLGTGLRTWRGALQTANDIDAVLQETYW